MEDIKKIQEFFSKPLEADKLNEAESYKKGDKLKLKLPNGKEFDVVFDAYSKQDGVAFGKFKDENGEFDTKPFDLSTIVNQVNEGKHNAGDESLNEEFSSTEEKMIKQIKSYKKRGSAMVNLPSKVRDFYFKNKEKIDALNEGFKVGDKVTYLGHPAVVTAAKEYNGRDFVSVSYDKGNGATKARMILATSGDVKAVNEMDINDPVLMKMRAAKNKLKSKPRINPEYASVKNAKKIAFLKKEREQLMRDMEQEAEPEGGPIADEYGSKLNRIDAAIAKLSGRKEMTYDQAIAEELSPKDFPVNFTYGGTTYVFNKIDRKDRAVYYNPRMDGDIAVFRSREEMDSFLDDYTSPRGGTQSSQFEAIAEGDDKIKDLESQLDFHTQMDNKGRASIIKDKIEKLRKLSNSGKIDGDEFLDKFTPLQKQLKAIAEEFTINEVKEMTFGAYLDDLDNRFVDLMKASKGLNAEGSQKLI
jgi:hypothetical protein